jgi:hypothetical protein
MKLNARLAGVGLVVLALGFWFLATRGGAADDKGGASAAVLKIAQALEKKDMEGAKTQAKALAGKSEVEDVMHMFSLRRAKGHGVGPKPGAINPDGIEAKLIDLAKKAKPAAQITTEADALVEMGYIAAAIGEFAKAKPPEKDEGKKKKKDWLMWSGEMQEAALAFADAAKTKNPENIKKAATKLYASCNTCHAVFKDE